MELYNGLVHWFLVMKLKLLTLWRKKRMLHESHASFRTFAKQVIGGHQDAATKMAPFKKLPVYG